MVLEDGRGVGVVVPMVICWDSICSSMSRKTFSIKKRKLDRLRIALLDDAQIGDAGFGWYKFIQSVPATSR